MGCDKVLCADVSAAPTVEGMYKLTVKIPLYKVFAK